MDAIIKGLVELELLKINEEMEKMKNERISNK
jgi:hypothetical protein